VWVRAGVLVPAHGLGPRAAVVSAQAASLGGVAGVEAGAGAPLRRLRLPTDRRRQGARAARSCCAAARRTARKSRLGDGGFARSGA
jgi:hypothetical protein